MLFLVLISTSSYGEEKIDIWQQKKEKGQTPKILETDKKIKQKNNLNISGKIESKPAIEIEDDLNNESKKLKFLVFMTLLIMILPLICGPLLTQMTFEQV